MTQFDFGVHDFTIPPLADGTPVLRGPNGEPYGYEWSEGGGTQISACLDEILHNKGSGKILEIGCASGARAFEFARMGWHVVAADITNRQRDIDARNAALRGLGKPEIRFLQHDFRREEGRGAVGNGYDSVNAGLLVHFFTLEEIARFMGFMRAITTDNAVLALSFLSMGNYKNFEELISGTKKESKMVKMKCGTRMRSHPFGAIFDLVKSSDFLVTDVFLNFQMKGLVARRQARGSVNALS